MNKGAKRERKRVGMRISQRVSESYLLNHVFHEDARGKRKTKTKYRIQNNSKKENPKNKNAKSLDPAPSTAECLSRCRASSPSVVAEFRRTTKTTATTNKKNQTNQSCMEQNHQKPTQKNKTIKTKNKTKPKL